ncbi:peroxiredoxin family protein [Nitrococcus mobilis]|uniref:Thioredoxin n=1 Tax=Nitrococcus mobilis Nb-231 TaxID=314278 RepID=A4BP20_9GAMM|nr:TlpA disulfide reductase family protein [Nitrococcus mobilis]EAR22321.1 thioredoxin [Nitrococcus mobilis Nb-231]
MNRGPLWWSLIVLIVLLVGVTIGIGSHTWYSNLEGSQRPVFTLPAMSSGKQKSIAEWDGKLVVLNFWATWCEPCRREIPLLITLQRQYEERGLQVLGVAIDSRVAIRDFAATLSINYPVLYGVEAAMDVAASYGDEQGTLPYTVVIDRSGRIRQVFRKELKRPDIEPVIRELL